MKVDVMARGDGRSVERSRLVVPMAECGFDLFVDPVSDGLNDLGLDDVALRVDGDLDHYVSDKIARQRITVNGRVRIDSRIGDMNLMTFDRTVNHGAERRASVGVAISRLGAGSKLRGLRSRLGLSFWRRICMRLIVWEEQLGRVGRCVGVRLGRDINELVVVGALSEGKPGGAEVDDARVAKNDYGQERQVRGHRYRDCAVAPELRSDGLETSKHVTP